MILIMKSDTIISNGELIMFQRFKAVLGLDHKWSFEDNV